MSSSSSPYKYTIPDILTRMQASPFQKIGQPASNRTNPRRITHKIFHAPDEFPRIRLNRLAPAKRLCATFQPLIVFDTVTNLSKPDRWENMLPAWIEQHAVPVRIIAAARAP